MQVTELLTPRLRPALMAGFNRALTTGNISLARHPLETTGLKQDGTEFPLELTFDGAKYDDKWVFFFMLRDTTYVRQSEQSLHRLNQQLRAVNDGLVKSNEELNQFAAMASHDLKSPLRQIVLYVQLLRKQLGDKLNDDERRLMDNIIDDVLRMQGMVNGLLVSSQAVDEAEHRPVSMVRVMELTLRGMDDQLTQNNAKVHLPDTLPVVMGDETGLVQVFHNLTVTTSCQPLCTGSPAQRLLESRCAPQGSDWEFAVKDNGIGIKSEDLDQVWTVFRRLHGDEYPGTGLGLPVVKKVVEQYGGKVRVESEEGIGSTFFVTLPAAPDQ